MADKLKTFSVVINWSDTDREQGTFGATVRAVDWKEAEGKVRKEMRDTYLAEHGSGEEAEEMAADREHDDPYTGEVVFGGSVVECSEGAHWKSVEMEAALRKIAEWSHPDCGKGSRIYKLANDIIADIDAL